MYEIQTLDELDGFKETEAGLLVLFGGRNCNVCHVIKPKIKALVSQHYPKLKMVYVDCHVTTAVCAQQSIFNLPTLQVYFTGQRFIEEVRSFSVQKVLQEIERPYSMLFGVD